MTVRIVITATQRLVGEYSGGPTSRTAPYAAPINAMCPTIAGHDRRAKSTQPMIITMQGNAGSSAGAYFASTTSPPSAPTSMASNTGIGIRPGRRTRNARRGRTKRQCGHELPPLVLARQGFENRPEQCQDKGHSAAQHTERGVDTPRAVANHRHRAESARRPDVRIRRAGHQITLCSRH